MRFDAMRFDDSLATILSADTSTPLGVESAWRQLVDLIARRRVGARPDLITRLRQVRRAVPAAVRASSARAAAESDPPAPIVDLFADDMTAIAAPVLRSASLTAADWIARLPTMSPAARSILRHRRDLPGDVVLALQSFGSVDFVLGTGGSSACAGTLIDDAGARATGAMLPRVDRDATIEPEAAPEPATVTEPQRMPTVAGFPIAELVARIDAFNHQREASPALRRASQAELFEHEVVPAPSFRFETDASGLFCWVEGASREALIGLSLGVDTVGFGGSGFDGVATGAFRRRGAFGDARMVVGGTSDASGAWRIDAAPVFDRASGRFTGYRGSARRPRVDEAAEPPADRRQTSDALRQLVHELRTPTNAIAGFAEMIEGQMVGPVAVAYRTRAAAIRHEAQGLVTAIDDIDLAARIASRALDLAPGEVVVAPLLASIAHDLAPLATLRGTTIRIDPGVAGLAIAGDERAVERLLGRLLATLIASGGQGETIGITVRPDGSRLIKLVADRPAGLARYVGSGLLTIDAEVEATREGAPLLGTGFALRLAQNLATELGGSFDLGDDVLTLRLPAVVLTEMDQVSSN